jgi:hypothetical protein
VLGPAVLGSVGGCAVLMDYKFSVFPGRTASKAAAEAEFRRRELALLGRES